MLAKLLYLLLTCFPICFTSCLLAAAAAGARESEGSEREAKEEAGYAEVVAGDEEEAADAEKEEAGDAQEVDEWLLSVLRAPFIQVSPGTDLNYFFTSCFTSCFLAISVLRAPFIQVSPCTDLNLCVYV